MAGPASRASRSDQKGGLSGSALGSLHSGSSAPTKQAGKGYVAAGCGNANRNPASQSSENVGLIVQKPLDREFQNMSELKIPVDDTLDDMGARFADACRRAERAARTAECSSLTRGVLW